MINEPQTPYEVKYFKSRADGTFKSGEVKLIGALHRLEVSLFPATHKAEILYNILLLPLYTSSLLRKCLFTVLQRK
jgi:hypothetical protein